MYTKELQIFSTAQARGFHFRGEIISGSKLEADLTVTVLYPPLHPSQLHLHLIHRKFRDTF